MIILSHMTDQFRKQLDAFEMVYMKNLFDIVSRMNKHCVQDHINELEGIIGNVRDVSRSGDTFTNRQINDFRRTFINGRIQECISKIQRDVTFDFSERIKEDLNENGGYYVDLILGDVELK